MLLSRFPLNVENNFIQKKTKEEWKKERKEKGGERERPISCEGGRRKGK
jgi:hypothetical protein